MKRILYLMHVPWGWIKQRPHFFAEYLSRDCCVDVYYKKPILVAKQGLLTAKEENNSLNIQGFRQISFDKIPVVKYLGLNHLNDWMLSWQLPDFKKYDYVWFTCASMYLLFKNRIVSGNKIIYDCMDDILEFPFCKKNQLLQRKMLQAEKELIGKSYKIFCSAEYLKDKILTRAKQSKEVIVLNNAIELPIAIDTFPDDVHSKISLLQTYSHSLLYIGTISAWFDFELLQKTLERYNDLHLMLVGPTDVNIPKHPRIHYLGTVERRYIFLLMQNAWCLIMPFKINELIRSVNPVKLYEYMYMGKHVIAPEYGETLKFRPYVNLYKTDNDFFALIGRLLTGDELSNKQREDMRVFAENNTWRNRYKIIQEELKL